MSYVIKNEADFEKTVLQAPGVVAVFFWYPESGPCRFANPHVEKWASEFEGQLVVVKVNANEADELIYRFAVKSYPTMLFFKDGQEIDRGESYVSKGKFREVLAR